jgi:hypothetical protein
MQTVKSKSKLQQGYSLWSLLVMLSGASALGGALSVAIVEKVSGSSFVMAIFLGLVLAASCSWFIWLIGRKALAHLELELKKETPDPKVDVTLWSLYISALAWTIVSAVLSSFLVATFIKHFLK